MKNIKQLFVCLLAISMTISVSAHAIATDAMESAISPIVITRTWLLHNFCACLYICIRFFWGNSI